VVPGFAEKPSFLRNRSKSLSTLGFEKSSFATSRIFRSLFSWPKPRSEKPSDRRLFRDFRTDTQSEACQSILMTSAVQTGLYFRARHTGYHDAIYAVSACSGPAMWRVVMVEPSTFLKKRDFPSKAGAFDRNIDVLGKVAQCGGGPTVVYRGGKATYCAWGIEPPKSSAGRLKSRSDSCKSLAFGIPVGECN
jgi:hypothetical protein